MAVAIAWRNSFVRSHSCPAITLEALTLKDSPVVNTKGTKGEEGIIPIHTDNSTDVNTPIHS